MAVSDWLRELDDDALTGRLTARFAHPTCSSWQAWWALGGAVYGAAVGSWFLLAVITFDEVQPSELLLAVGVGFPWPALPLAWALRTGRARVGGGVAAALAAAHFLLLLGSWGIELLYVPLVLVGLVVSASPASRIRS